MTPRRRALPGATPSRRRERGGSRWRNTSAGFQAPPGPFSCSRDPKVSSRRCPSSPVRVHADPSPRRRPLCIPPPCSFSSPHTYRKSSLRVADAPSGACRVTASGRIRWRRSARKNRTSGCRTSYSSKTTSSGAARATLPDVRASGGHHGLTARGLSDTLADGNGRWPRIDRTPKGRV